MKAKSCPALFGLVVVLFLQAGSADWQPASQAAGKVKLLRIPNGGIQPQAALDERGVLHLVYFAGEPRGGDIYYVRRDAGKTEFTSPLRVNSEPGRAIAIGTIRGAQLAIGKNGRVRVAWNGRHKPDGRAAPMLYARMNDARGFDPQVKVTQFSGGLDGGGSIAAHKSGNVYVAWHGKETRRAKRIAASGSRVRRMMGRHFRVKPSPRTSRQGLAAAAGCEPSPTGRGA